jgi:hypothetical protein
MTASTRTTGNREPGHWRLGLALCASVAAHVWVLAVLPQGQRATARASLTIEARLVLPGINAEPVAGNDSPDPSRLNPFSGAQAVPVTRQNRAPAVTATRTPESGARALPQPVDPTWYGAHEIDSYPRALAPLQLVPRAAGHGRDGARLLLWLRIDELGQLVEVAAGEAGVPGELLDAARASLTAVRFTPARKDERAVKSRIQVSIAY